LKSKSNKQQRRLKDVCHVGLFFSKSQYLSHVLLFIFMILFGGFCVMSAISLNYMNPLIFCFFRATIIAVGMLPLPIIIDWRFQFSSQRTYNNDPGGFCSQSPLIRLIQSKFPDRNNFFASCSMWHTSHAKSNPFYYGSLSD